MDGILELPISRMMLLQRIMRTFHELHKTVASQYTKKISGHALIVDDNRLNRIALESILHNIGMTSLLAENGTRAIEMVKEHMFDVILMDIQMPHMDGLEATLRIRSLGTNSSKVPIIAVTANAYFNDYDMLKATQINDVIYKPIKMESLSQILRKHLVSVDTLHIPDELLVFDRHDFLKRFEGSYDIAKEVIMTFQQEYPKDLEKIRSAVQLRHAEQIISAAHYFKGSCAYVSGKRLVWLLNVMMERAKKNDLDDMNDVFHLLMKESDELMTHLESMKAITS
jgi:two-component system sensor histidine kinase BarA